MKNTLIIAAFLISIVGFGSCTKTNNTKSETSFAKKKTGSTSVPSEAWEIHEQVEIAYRSIWHDSCGFPSTRVGVDTLINRVAYIAESLYGMDADSISMFARDCFNYYGYFDPYGSNVTFSTFTTNVLAGESNSTLKSFLSSVLYYTGNDVVDYGKGEYNNLSLVGDDPAEMRAKGFIDILEHSFEYNHGRDEEMLTWQYGSTYYLDLQKEAGIAQADSRGFIAGYNRAKQLGNNDATSMKVGAIYADMCSIEARNRAYGN